MFKKPVVAIIIFLCICSGCSSPQFLGDTGWVYLDYQKAAHLTEKDVFTTSSTVKFTALQFYVKDRDVEIKEVRIVLINGDVLLPALENKIKANDRSRIIELAADGRQLDRVEIRYNSAGNLFSKKGTVVLVGKQFDQNPLQ